MSVPFFYSRCMKQGFGDRMMQRSLSRGIIFGPSSFRPMSEQLMYKETMNCCIS